MDSDSQRKRRVRLAFRRLVIVAFPILLIVAAHSVWDHVELRRLAGEIDRIRERREPITYMVGVTRFETPVGDAGRYYLSAALVSPEVPFEDYNLLLPWFSGVVPPVQKTDLKRAHGFVRTEGFFRDSRYTFELIDAASKLPFTAFRGVEYSNQASNLITLARANAFRTLAYSFAGDGDGAVRSALTDIRLRRATKLLRLLRQREHEVPAILSLTRPSDASLQELQRALEAQDASDALVDDFIRERARYLDAVGRPILGNAVAPGGPIDILRPAAYGASMVSAFWRPYMAHQLVEHLRVWAELIEVAKVPWPQKAVAARDAIARHPEEPRRGPRRLYTPFVPPIVFFKQAVLPDSLIMDRAGRVAIAIERYRRAHADALPAALADLVPEYLESVPLDPLTGRSLLYRQTPDSYTLYSVGADGEDDEGMLLKQNPPSSMSRFSPGEDIGMRILLKRPDDVPLIRLSLAAAGPN